MKTLSKEQVLRLHNALLETFGGTAGIVTMVYWNLL